MESNSWTLTSMLVLLQKKEREPGLSLICERSTPGILESPQSFRVGVICGERLSFGKLRIKSYSLRPFLKVDVRSNTPPGFG